MRINTNMRYTFLLIISILILSSCNAKHHHSNEYDVYTQSYNCIQPKQLSFTGSIYYYTFMWENERDREWEEDVVYFATVVLEAHPLFINNEVFVRNHINRIRFSSLSRHIFYDAELRHKFIVQVNNLIAQIPNLSDIEIFMSLSRLLALTDDSHTRMLFHTWDFGPMIPMAFWHLCEGLYVRVAPSEFEEILLSRLIAINGVCVEEIYELLYPIISGTEKTVMFFLPSLLFQQDILTYLNIVEEDSATAALKFVNIDGQVSTVEVPFVGQVGITESANLVEHTIDTEILMQHSRPSENYWFKYFPEESLFYLRMRRSQEVAGLASRLFFSDIKEKIIEMSGVEKFVIDLRGNSGGASLEGYDIFLRWLMFEEGYALLGRVFIAIDLGTVSAGVIFASQMNYVVENSILIGQSTAGAVNFFSNATTRTLPNSNISFQVSRGYSISWPSYEYSSLMPNIYIPRTIEDYRDSRDVVLEFIKAYQITTED